MSRRPAVGILACVLALAACRGVIGDLEGDPSPGVSTQPVCTDGPGDPGPSPIRRLNRFEYDNTVRDLLGDTTHPARNFPHEEEVAGFSNNAAVLNISPVLAEQYMTAAEQLAARAVGTLDTLMACDPGQTGDACVRSFVKSFGRRAFRRPLTDDEFADFYALYQDQLAATGVLRDGVRVVVSAMLQSPAFLYRVELGDPRKADAGRVGVTGFEMASRLSYLLWGSMPDEALFEAAATGHLSTDADIEAQARRMVKDAKAEVMVSQFHREWFALDGLDLVSKSPDVFPEWSTELRADLGTETQMFLDEAFWKQGTLDAMLTAPYTFVNARLAAFYGLALPKADGFVKVDVDPAQRMGLLTQGSLLATNAKANQGSPIHRGKWVRERLLCDVMPSPPPNLNVKAPDIKPGTSERDRFAQHTTDSSCRKCHELMDPIGFGFEHFDGIGRWRTNDGGKPIDATGEIVNGGDTTGTFDGAGELARKLAASQKVKACVVLQWFRYGYGRSDMDVDRCTLQKLQDKLVAAKGDLRELLVQLALTDAFKYRRAASMSAANPMTAVATTGGAK